MPAARADVESLSVGAARQQRLPVIVADFLGMLNQAIGARLEGVVGYNFLRHYRVTIGSGKLYHSSPGSQA